MTILPVITFPAPILKERSLEVSKVDDDLRNLMDNMLETMYSQSGVGLAAVQVGVLKRVLVMDVSYMVEDCDGNHHDHNNNHLSGQKPMFLVNPKIIKSSSESSVYYEGCLSFPELRADIIRPKEVEIEYLDYNGDKKNLKASGLLSTCVQHEIDHLNGITFVDYLSKLKRDMLLKKLKKLSKK
jgi:peptide deformylase